MTLASITKTYFAFTITVDFKGINTSSTQVFKIINTQLTDVETLKFLKQGKVAKIGFLSSEASGAALDHGLSLQGCLVPLTRCYTLKANITQVTIWGRRCFSKEETKEVIQGSLAPHGWPCQ